ncbi:hypothetical protein AVEN_49234-1 [Araneus ventricosus]|uniref:Uncharacterized protein n=1 Tax=Araneus ventricosus TaxID=182803 RepID=A0A4Y2JVQ0_ARAVE|nr:hypothetical protein AVEN_49234-1 [Araneus ventricosus]
MVAEAFVPSANQSIETGIEEIGVKVAEPLNEGFLNFSIGSEMTTYWVLLKRFEEMKISWCGIRTVGRVFQYIPSETLYQITCNRGRVWFYNNRASFKSCPGRFLRIGLCTRSSVVKKMAAFTVAPRVWKSTSEKSASITFCYVGTVLNFL